MILCCTGPQFWHATMFELQTKHLQLHVIFFSRRADQIKQAPAPARSGFNLHGPRCHSNLTTPHCSLPTLHPSISHLACYARTPSLWLHSHIVVSPGPAVNSQYMLPPLSAITYLSRHRHRDWQPATELCSSPWSSNSSCWLNGEKHPTNPQPEELYNLNDKHEVDLLSMASHWAKQAVCVPSGW